jgi:predicted transcriptional regulator
MGSLASNASRKRPPTAFGALLQSHLRHHNMSLRAYALRVGIPYTYVHKVIYGDRPPPLDHIAHWAETLHLNPEQSEYFIEEATIATGVPALQALVRRLQAAQSDSRPLPRQITPS